MYGPWNNEKSKKKKKRLLAFLVSTCFKSFVDISISSINHHTAVSRNSYNLLHSRYSITIHVMGMLFDPSSVLHNSKNFNKITEIEASKIKSKVKIWKSRRIFEISKNCKTTRLKQLTNISDEIHSIKHFPKKQEHRLDEKNAHTFKNIQSGSLR